MRSDVLKKVRRVIIKVGSRVLTRDDGCLDATVIARIADELSQLRAEGREVVLVSSGAVAAGRHALAGGDRPRTIPQKQAAAAIGQPRLMHAYEEAFSRFGASVGQVLLTREDLANRQRFLNARATLDTLLAEGVVPIINENDTVAVEEIKFGDNDNLSALVTTLAEGDLLIIMTDIDGFYDANPRTNPEAKLIPLVRSITREMELAAGGSGSAVGTGGMVTKLAAAKKVCRSGVPVIMLNGRKPGSLSRALADEETGTLFLPAGKSLNRRKHWIAFTLRPAGRILVDDGARKVLAAQGRSLLPSGIMRVEGKFDRGACVRVCGPDGTEFARGIADYSHEEIARVLGHRSSEIETILGYRYSDEIIHRDNLVVL
ncbi:glutamate 5-kinase [Geobacter sp. DSM 9736]|uniref:glutamate 5-kinase n=1 Tax=Geobacter sp. DSM 9736 TaxID=1277350 RepID=UPI000B507280|nr:glutamate 5-kinase [Geobacter sp. DSM 9736]SNB47854.1 glutamate 5-kinase [Geobacter sp. DSM 9736]